MPFCTKCGTEFSEGDEFCSKCGKAIAEQKPPPEPKSVTGTQSSSRRILGALVVTVILLGIVVVFDTIRKPVYVGPAVTPYTPPITPAPKIERSKIIIDTTPKNAEIGYDEGGNPSKSLLSIKVENNNDIGIEIVQFCTFRPQISEPYCIEGGTMGFGTDIDRFITEGDSRYGLINIGPRSSRYLKVEYSIYCGFEYCTKKGTYTDYMKIYLKDKDGSFKQNLLAEIPITIKVNK